MLNRTFRIWTQPLCKGVLSVMTGFRVPARPMDQTAFPSKILTSFGPQCCYQQALGKARFAPGGHPTPSKGPFAERFCRHFSRRPSVIIDICSVLRSPYPAGDGSAAIFCMHQRVASRRPRLDGRMTLENSWCRGRDSNPHGAYAPEDFKG